MLKPISISLFNQQLIAIIIRGEELFSLDEPLAFSVPDERLGEVVGACVQLREGATLTRDSLLAFLDGTLAKYKLPAFLWAQHELLPRAATDKSDRRSIRAACLNNREATV